MDQSKVKITIFQASYASLMEHGLYLKMHDHTNPFQDPIPAEYYLPVFSGDIAVPDNLPEDQETRISAILEHAFYIFKDFLPQAKEEVA